MRGIVRAHQTLLHRTATIGSIGPWEDAIDDRRVTIDEGVVRIDQCTRVAHTAIGTDVSGPACLFATVNVMRGAVGYLHGNTCVPAPRSFSIFVPPFTMIQARLDRCEVATSGVAFRLRSAASIPAEPVLFPCEVTSRHENDVLRCLSEADTLIPIGRTRDPLPLAQHAKALLDQHYGTRLQLRAVAARLSVSPTNLSRTFKRTWGMAPVAYRHHLRVIDALLRLAEGEVPASVFQDVGFEDLSRFYKIFGRLACAPPGTYRPLQVNRSPG